MTDDERREMLRNNYAAQMKMLGYQPDGNPKDLVEIVRCKDCKWHSENGFCKHPNGGAGNIRPVDWFCADGERQEG